MNIQNSSGVDYYKDHDYENGQQHQDGADLSHIFRLQQFTQFGLGVLHFCDGVVDSPIELFYESSLFGEVGVDGACLRFDALDYGQDLLNCLVLLQLLFLEGFHLIITLIDKEYT